jgi:acyl-activating enzyme 14
MPTSAGTTGQSKGVALSHTAFLTQYLTKLIMLGYSAADVYLHVPPMFHIGGLSYAVAALMAGTRYSVNVH